LIASTKKALISKAFDLTWKHLPGPELIAVVLFLSDICSNLLNAAFIDEFTAQHTPCIGQAVTRRGELALGIMDTFAQNNPDGLWLFAGDANLENLATFRLHFDLLVVH
jgi:hypothetical protein